MHMKIYDPFLKSIWFLGLVPFPPKNEGMTDVEPGRETGFDLIFILVSRQKTRTVVIRFIALNPNIFTL